MKKQKTNLGKRVHVYGSLEEMEKQFASDVATMGQELTAIVDEQFDLKNPWDQTVLAAILTNMLAFVQVHAELDGASLEAGMRECYSQNLTDYRNQVKQNLMKKGKK